MVKKVILLVGDFAEDMEVFGAFHTLLTVGLEVHAICPNKKIGEKIATSVHDFEGHQTYVERLGHSFELNATFDEVNATEYDGLYIAGGRAPEYLRLNEKVVEMVRHFLEANKPLAAICHGP
jgi:protease I